MTTKTTVTCDKCRDEMPPEMGYVIMDIMFTAGLSYHGGEYNLCYRCTKLLKKWVKEK